MPTVRLSRIIPLMVNSNSGETTDLRHQAHAMQKIVDFLSEIHSISVFRKCATLPNPIMWNLVVHPDSPLRIAHITIGLSQRTRGWGKSCHDDNTWAQFTILTAIWHYLTPYDPHMTLEPLHNCSVKYHPNHCLCLLVIIVVVITETLPSYDSQQLVKKMIHSIMMQN